MNLLAIPPQRRVVWLVLLFLLVGQVMLFSATGVMGLQKFGSELHYVIRQSSCALIGFALMIALSRFPYQNWRKLAWLLLLLQIGLVAATLLSPLGHFAQGATRWLRLGSFAFQPSEIAKVTVAIFAAHILAVRTEKPVTPKQLAFCAMPLVLLLFLIFRQPDMGTTVLLTVTLVGLLFLAGIPVRYFAGAILVGAVGVGYAILTSEYRRRRLLGFLNPWEDPQGAGFQSIQSFLSLYSGKLFGVGLGNGNSKLFFLPEVHTDFIFALVGEELGFLGAGSLLVLFLYFLHLLFKATRHAPDNFGFFLGAGLSLSLALQIGVNLGGVTGLLPVKGLPLPFVSWGRSALLVNLAVVGILLNIIRQTRTTDVPPKK